MNEKTSNQTRTERVKCPKCGYIMPISYTEDAECGGVYVACKGRNCKNVFEVRIKKGKQDR